MFNSFISAGGVRKVGMEIQSLPLIDLGLLEFSSIH